DNSLPVILELRVIKMAMRIDKLHRGGLLQPGPGGNIFVEAGENRQPPVGGSRHNHALRRESAEFSRLQVRDDNDLPADELLRFIGESDSGNDAAQFRFADIDFEMEELIRAFDCFGGFHFDDAQIDFGKIVNRDQGLRKGLRGLWFLAEQFGLAVAFNFFQVLHLLDGWFLFDARKGGLDFSYVPRQIECSPARDSGADRVVVSELLPNQICRMRKDGLNQTADDVQPRNGGVENAIQLLLGVRIIALGELPGRVFDDQFVKLRDEGPDLFQGVRKIEAVIGIPNRGGGSGSFSRELIIIAAGGNQTAAILLNHVQRAASKIAEAIGEIGVVAAHSRVETDTAILPEYAL